MAQSIGHFSNYGLTNTMDGAGMRELIGHFTMDASANWTGRMVQASVE